MLKAQAKLSTLKAQVSRLNAHGVSSSRILKTKTSSQDLSTGISTGLKI